VIGPWYDPIGRRWHLPRPAAPVQASSAYESEEDKGRRIARYNAIWEALTATAQASQQQEVGR